MPQNRRRNTILDGRYGRYKLIRRLAKSARGQTYLAEVVWVFSGYPKTLRRFLRKGAIVVLKLPPSLSKSYDPEKRGEFLDRVTASLGREYSLSKRLLRVKGVAHIVDIGLYFVKLDGKDMPSNFLVCEYIDGTSLDDLLK